MKTDALFDALTCLLPLQYEEDKLLDRRICTRCRVGAELDLPCARMHHRDFCEVGATEDLLDEHRKERNLANARSVMHHD